MNDKSILFSPYALKDMTLKNRVVMSPMLMYQADEDGTANERHVLHYGARALGGVGLVMTEVVAVHPDGRISTSDLGLWSDDQVPGMRRIADGVHSCEAKFGVQLAHAGRKARLPNGGVGPSPIAHSADSPVPVELSPEDVDALVKDYGRAAARADLAGADCVQIHAAHGYLIHQFLAEVSNQRTDEYGGSLKRRAKFLLDIVRSVRGALSPGKPVLVRFSGTDLVEGGVSTDDAAQLASWLEAAGADFLEITSGNITAEYSGEVYPGYQSRYVPEIRQSTGLPMGTVGSIHSAQLAEYLLRRGDVDLVFIGRALLRDPFWPIHAATELGLEPALPIPTYARATGPFERGF